MKAWIVKEKGEFCSAVVFAENRNKAKSIAQTTDACEDAEYIYISRLVVYLKLIHNTMEETKWIGMIPMTDCFLSKIAIFIVNIQSPMNVISVLQKNIAKCIKMNLG